MDWSKIASIVACVIFSFFIIQNLRKHPEQLSKENLNQSFSTMGLLGLALIAFLAVIIFLLKSTQ